METPIELTSLLLVGWIAGAELGSWCYVQPVVARLPYEQYIAAEQAMLRTFGRIMPVLMPLSGVLAIVLVVVSYREPAASSLRDKYWALEAGTLAAVSFGICRWSQP